MENIQYTEEMLELWKGKEWIKSLDASVDHWNEQANKSAGLVKSGECYGGGCSCNISFHRDALRRVT
jgi:hypothetical protein